MKTNRAELFLSHNSKDKELVVTLLARLEEEFDIDSWLDVHRIRPGSPWREEIDSALRSCTSCAIVLGPSGWGDVHLLEARTALAERREHGRLAVIPVLLPGAREEDIPGLGESAAEFASLHYADFRRGMDDPAALGSLVAAVRGAPVEPPVGLSVFRIRRDARRWESTGEKDATKLYRGSDLLEAQQIAQKTGLPADSLERRFLDAAVAQEQADFRRQRARARKLIAGLAAGLAIVLAAAVFALWQRSLATERELEANDAAKKEAAAREGEKKERKRAEAGEADAKRERDEADEQRKLALARQLAAQAELVRRENPAALELSTLLAAHSLLTKPLAEGRTAAATAVGLLPEFLGRRKLPEAFAAVRISPGHTYLAGWNVGSLRLSLVSMEESRFGAVQTLDFGGLSFIGFAFSPDDSRIAVATPDGEIRIWELPSGKALPGVHIVGYRPNSNYGYGLAISPGGRYVVWLGEHLRVWRTSGEATDEVPIHDELPSGLDGTTKGFIAGMAPSVQDRHSSVEFSADGTRLAVARSYRVVTIYSFPFLEVLSRLRSERDIDGLTFDPAEANAFWTGGRKWRLDNAAVSLTIGGGHGVDLDGKRHLALTSGAVCHIWDARSGLEIAQWQHDAARAAWFDGDGSFRSAGQGEVRKWRLTNSAPVSVGPVSSEDLTEDREVLVAGGAHNLVSVKMRDRRATPLLETDESILRVAVERHGKLVAANTGRRTSVWSMEGDSRREPAWSEDGPVSGLYFSHGGEYLLVCDNPPFQSGFLDCRRYEARSGEKAGWVSGRFVDRCLGFTQDDSGALVWRSRKSLNVVKFADRSEQPFALQPPEQASSAWFSRDGSTLYTVEQSKPGTEVLRIWDVATRRQRQAFTVGFEIVDAAVSPSGRYVVTAGGDQTVRVWDFEHAEELTRLPQGEKVHRVAFYSGDETVLTVDAKSVRLQGWKETSLLERMCRGMTRNLDLTEWGRYVGAATYAKACAGLP